jgi:hypothetical protein
MVRLPLVDDTALDTSMLVAHDAGDISALVDLYQQAAELREASGDIEAACFYLTHAYVFALDLGRDDAVDLYGRLKDHGREE